MALNAAQWSKKASPDLEFMPMKSFISNALQNFPKNLILAAIQTLIPAFYGCDTQWTSHRGSDRGPGCGGA